MPDCRVLVAGDAEEALRHANQHGIDLAILDWNLGAGNDGLRLLEDLSVFQPDIVAILVTGYAHQATPLDALRMGVRDYLDKNQDLNRDTFLAAVRKQLDRIRPAKRQRELHRQLVAFRAAVEQVLPLVQSAAALNDPVPLPRAVAGLSRFLCQITGAKDGVLDRPLRRKRWDRRDLSGLRRGRRTDGSEPGPVRPIGRGDGPQLRRAVRDERLAPRPTSSCSRSSAAGRRCWRRRWRSGPACRRCWNCSTGPAGSATRTAGSATAAAEIGAELLRQALAERATRRTLFDAVAAALDATQTTDGRRTGRLADRPTGPPPAAVLDRLRADLESARSPAVGGEATLRLAEAVRELAVRHGEPAVEHCIRLVQSVRELLDRLS